MKERSAEHRRKISENSKRLWKDPEFRERLIKKQRSLGLRTYTVDYRYKKPQEVK